MQIKGSLVLAGIAGLIAVAQAQHGISLAWQTPESQVSQSPSIASGVVGRNIAVDRTGRIHVVWTENAGTQFDVFYAFSDDAGATWSRPRDIVNSPLPAFSPNLAVAPNDSLHMTWVDRRAPGGTPRVFYSRSFDRGATWTPAMDLSGPSPEPAGPAMISADNRGRIHIAYHLGNPDGGATPAICYYVRSVDGGHSFSSPLRLSTNTGRHAAFPRFSAEGTPGDLIAIAWRDNRRNPDWDIYVAVSNDGGQTFVERVGHAAPQRDWDPDAIVDPQGVIHLAWMSEGPPAGVSIDYKRSADQGQTWTPPVRLSQARSRFPFLVKDPRRPYMWLFWKDERDAEPPPSQNFRADIACKLSVDGGRSWSQMEFATDLGNEEVKFPGIAIDPAGRPNVVWSDRRQGANLEQVHFKRRHLIGDIDRNGCVDDADLSILLEMFGRAGLQVEGDLDMNGIVDDRDLAMMLPAFGSGCR